VLIVKTIAAILLVLWSIAATAQARISIPDVTYKAHDRIDVEIENAGASDVTFCVEYGYSSSIDAEHAEPTPTPVYVQQKSSRGWDTLLTGPDIGSSPHPVTLGARESQHFPFRVNAHGTVRIVLEYRVGSDENFCFHRKGVRVARSREFSIE
jgi:hypothetical protein